MKKKKNSKNWENVNKRVLASQKGIRILVKCSGMLTKPLLKGV